MSQQRGMLWAAYNRGGLSIIIMRQLAYLCVCQITDVFIAASIRTPLGCFNGSLGSVSATKLGSIAIEGE